VVVLKRAVSTPGPQFPIRRNTALLAAATACYAGLGQLVAAVATLTFVLVTGIESLLGLGPALVIGTAALAAFPAGRAMDRFGRVPVLAAGFLSGGVGSILIGIGARTVSTPLVLAGFVLVGTANGAILLIRTPAGDMYPDRRGRGVSLVLFGAVFGAALGPLVFTPLFGGRELEPDALLVPWLVAAGIMLLGVAFVLGVRPDPRRIAEALTGHDPAEPATAAAPLGVILRRPGVVPSLVAAVASWSVMVAVMNLTGYVVIGHGHHQHQLFPIVSAHLVGMFGLVLVVGDLIDRIGRRQALVGGLLLIGVSCVSLVWIESIAATALALFGLGLGWNFSFVAATAELADRTSAVERGRMLGFNDLLSGVCGASLALIGGYTFSEAGVAALGVGATLIAVAPVLWILVRGVPRPVTETG
jgi:MFS family permease